MKMLVIGDAHGGRGYMRNALDLAVDTDCELVFVVGDFGIWEHLPDGVVFLDWVSKWAEERGLWVYFCDGNHENFDALYSYPLRPDGFREVRPRILHAPRGHIWEWGGTTFMSMGGAHSIDGPGGVWYQARGPVPEDKTVMGPRGPIFVFAGDDLGDWWPEETITDEDVKTAIDNINNHPNPIDVMLTHDCPEGVNLVSEGMEGYPAGEANREMLAKVVDVAKPQILIHGHYHRSWIKRRKISDSEWTTVIGLASNEQPQGNYLFLDTKTGEIT